jgi:hypothetical protein
VPPLKKKKSPIIVHDILNRFEGSCGTFGEEKNTPLSSMALSQFEKIIIIIIKNK